MLMKDYTISRGIPSLKLTGVTKKMLYKKFNFYTLNLPTSSFFNFSKRQDPFLNLVHSHYFTYQFSNCVMPKLIRPAIIMTTPFFIYFDSGSKQTVLKPKYKIFLPLDLKNISQKEFIILSNKGFFTFLQPILLVEILRKFMPKSLKLNYLASFSLVCGRDIVFFKKFIGFQKNTYNSFYRLCKPYLSKHQKKINFLQFNIFFKNIIIK